MKRLTWREAAEVMLETHRRSGTGNDIADDTCPGLDCKTCPFQNWTNNRPVRSFSCEIVNSPDMKGKNTYKVALARSVGEKLDLI